MPNITITDEQAQALARGENITVSAPEPERKSYILTHQKTGKTYVVETEGGTVKHAKIIYGARFGWKTGEWKEITGKVGKEDWGHILLYGRSHVSGSAYSVTPVA